MGSGHLTDAGWDLTWSLLPPELGCWARPYGDSRASSIACFACYDWAVACEARVSDSASDTRSMSCSSAASDREPGMLFC